MCLPTMTQAGHEYATQCIRLVHTNALRIAPQSKDICVMKVISQVSFLKQITNQIKRLNKMGSRSGNCR